MYILDLEHGIVGKKKNTSGIVNIFEYSKKNDLS